TADLLAGPLRTADEALAARDGAARALVHARRLERDVEEAARARFEERDTLARAFAHAAYVDAMWRFAGLGASNPVTPLCALWETGYVLAALDARSVTLA